jgi:hypothetical protein
MYNLTSLTSYNDWVNSLPRTSGGQIDFWKVFGTPNGDSPGLSSSNFTIPTVLTPSAPGLGAAPSAPSYGTLPSVPTKNQAAKLALDKMLGEFTRRSKSGMGVVNAQTSILTKPKEMSGLSFKKTLLGSPAPEGTTPGTKVFPTLA